MTKFTGIFLAILLCLAAGMSWAQDSKAPYADIPKSRSADGGYILGHPESGIKLIEFSDFLCVSCQNYEPLVSAFISDYVLTGQAQFEYRMLPVIDPVLSVLSASLVECADALQPGSFWRARDHMFERAIGHGFTSEAVPAFAEYLGLDGENLGECAAAAEQHSFDVTYAVSLGVRSTPALFVQYGEAAPTQIALPLAEHFPAIVNAIRPTSTQPVTIQHGAYAGLPTFRRADGGFVLGAPNAPLTIVAFEDFLCPHCQTYIETVKRLVDDLVRAGKAQFEFRLYPLVNPQYSTTFAKTAECVAAQDLRLFWDAHDFLFEFAGSGSLSDVPAKLARLLDLDAGLLNACLDRAMQFLVDTELGQSVGVSGTPAIRARANQGELQVIYAGQQPQAKGGLPLEMLLALADGAAGISIGAPERSLLNERMLFDSSLVSDEPCAPPCWQNITPGETDMSAALEIVSAMPSLEVVQAVDSGIVFRQASGEPCCQISAADDGKVVSIVLQFAPQTGLGDVLAAQGEPDFVSGQPFSDEEAILLLYYPERRLLLYVVVAGEAGQLEETSPVVSAVFATEELFTQAFGMAPFDHWKGYLSYGEYMDGEFDYQP